MRRGTANRAVADARKLREHPLTAAACATHGTTKVRTMLRYVTDRTAEEYEQQEAMLLEQAEKLSVDQTAPMMQFWAMHADPDGADPANPDDNELHLSQTMNGRWDVDGNLDAVLGAMLHKSLAPIADRLWRASMKAGNKIFTRAQLMAEALRILLGLASKADAEEAASRRGHVDERDRGLPDHRRPAAQPSRPGRAHGLPADDTTPADEAGTETPLLGNCHIGSTTAPIRGETARRLTLLMQHQPHHHQRPLDHPRRRPNRPHGHRIPTQGHAGPKSTCEFRAATFRRLGQAPRHIKWWGRSNSKTDVDDLAWECTCHHVLMHEGSWTMQDSSPTAPSRSTAPTPAPASNQAPTRA